MFENSMLSNSTDKGRKIWTVLASTALQFVGLGVLVLLPLVFSETLPLASVRTTVFAPAPPPPPPPPVPAEVSVARPTKAKPPKTCAGSLCAPPKLPTKPARAIEEVEAPPDDKVVGKGVVGGTGTSSPGIVGGIPPAAPPPPPVIRQEPEKVKVQVARPEGPIRIGGIVQAANLVKKVTPVYPPLAKAARVQGTVRFTAIIGRDGAIQQLQVLGGHPLLVPAATEAVKQWVYRPTTLNGEPVEVITQIDVNFTLSS